MYHISFLYIILRLWKLTVSLMILVSFLINRFGFYWFTFCYAIFTRYLIKKQRWNKINSMKLLQLLIIYIDKLCVKNWFVITPGKLDSFVKKLFVNIAKLSFFNLMVLIKNSESNEKNAKVGLCIDVAKLCLQGRHWWRNTITLFAELFSFISSEPHVKKL